MTNEIKEILNKLNNKAEHYILYNYEVKLLLDYITNLQNEIFDLKDTIQNKNDCIGAYEYIIEDRDKRIDKANSILNKLVIMKPWENTDDPMRKIYRPIKNTTKQEVYRAIVELEDILRGDE